MEPDLFEIEISINAMEASVGLTPKGMSSFGVQEADVMLALRKEGVLHGVQKDRLASAVAHFRSPDRTRRMFLVAEGTPAQVGESGKMEALVNYGELAHGAQVVARLGPGRAAVTGSTVTGEEITAPPSDVPLQAGEGIEFRDTERSWIALEPGYLEWDKTTLRLVPLVKIAVDGMSATAEFRGLVPDPSTVKELLRETGIEFGIIEGTLEGLRGQKGDAANPIQALVARGKPQIRGRNARIQYCVDLGKVAVGTVRADGSIDYRRRRTFCLVEQGEDIAIRVPPTSGSDGYKVTGEVMPATPGEDKPLVAGQNVEARDGRRFVASVRGAAVQTDDRIDVLPSFAVQGDIDYEVGSIDSPINVVVDGDVRSAFECKARGEVKVAGSIEDAIVSATGNVEVTGGIMQGAVGSIRCGGALRAKFIENARVSARGDIFVADDVVSCQLVAGGRVEALSGKGTIIGGHIAAVAGVEAKVLGSRMNVRSTIQVGVSFDAIDPLDQRLRDIERELASILVAAGHGFLMLLESEDEIADDKMRQKIERWRRLEKKRASLQGKRTRVIERSAGQGLVGASVIVHEVAYPGTLLVFGARRSLLLREKKPAGRFYWDDKRGSIEFAPAAEAPRN